MAIRYTRGENTGFTPLPEGTYNLCITAEEDCTSKAGNPQHKVTFDVVDGPHAGHTLNAWYSFQPNAAWRFEQLITATGAEPTVVGQDAEGNDILELEDDALVGCYVTAMITQETYQGKVNNRVNGEQPCTDYAGPYSDDDSDYDNAVVEESAEDDTADAMAEPEKAPTPRRRARRAL